MAVAGEPNATDKELWPIEVILCVLYHIHRGDLRIPDIHTPILLSALCRLRFLELCVLSIRFYGRQSRTWL